MAVVKRPLGFLDGIGVGVGAIAMVPLLYWLVVHGNFIEMYKQMGSARIPKPTIFVFGPAWTYGAPILLGVGFGLAIWLRPNRWLIVAIAALAGIASLFTYYAAYLPIWQLAGNIQ